MYEIAKKLIGEVYPVGETNTDNVRYENLKDMTQLVEELLVDIRTVAREKNRPEHSIQRAGKFASIFLYEAGIEN
jgi:hypothetical protein